MPERPRQRTFDQPHPVVPGLTHGGWRRVRSADDTGLGPHDHGPAYELCLVVGGAVDWWVEEQVYAVRGGDAFLTRPRERHGGVDAVLQPSELFWVGFTLDPRDPVAGTTAQQTRALARRFGAIRRRHFPTDGSLTRPFAQLIDSLGRRDAIGALAARTAVCQLLLDTLRCHDAAEDVARRITPQIDAAMRWMNQRLGDEFAVDAAADAAGLSVTRFHERFRAEVGLPPGEWRTRQRVARAKALLREGKLSVTQVAMHCGFSTSQYFATVFKKQTGVSPRAYRAPS